MKLIPPTSKLLLENHFLIERVAFIGTREPTPEMITDVSINAIWAANKGYNLISGGAKGVDTIAEQNFQTQLVNPYVNPCTLIFTADIAKMVAREDQQTYAMFEHLAEINHPNWEAVRRRGSYVTNLLVRNAMIVWYADAVLAWPHPSKAGGTNHGINVAMYLKKPLEIMS